MVTAFLSAVLLVAPLQAQEKPDAKPAPVVEAQAERTLEDEQRARDEWRQKLAALLRVMAVTVERPPIMRE